MHSGMENKINIKINQTNTKKPKIQ